MKGLSLVDEFDSLRRHPLKGDEMIGDACSLSVKDDEMIGEDEDDLVSSLDDGMVFVS